ncbi:BTAD domain-containing putative transcriptional regulator [Streptomyces sp. NPDC018584]|uniref:AfsR/SARP family transcriptional regulator n=1 Tax=unclassified Streptomyces TaxID=2593676 RepID=UPI0037B9B4F4
MRLQLLGPVRAWRKGAELPLGPPKQRGLLGLLASRAGDVVHIEEIIDALWGSAVPRTAVNGVHTYVAGLRRAIEPGRGSREAGGLLVSSGGGYSLRLPHEEVDAHVFSQLHAQARRLRAEGDVRAALDTLEQALPLWHGEAYANIPGPFAAMERSRLQELRLAATEEWADDHLSLGRHGEVIVMLADLVTKEPLREKLRWLLMMALYRSGRRADALTLYRETRQLLRDELGIDPGPELRALHERMLGDHLDATGTPLREPSPVAPRAEPAPERWTPVRPAQLPPLTRGFLGRGGEQAQLRRLVADGGAQRRTTLALITGAPGVGKSALALRVASDLADDFPDGQFFVDLCGTSAERGPLPAMEALALLLRSLAVEESALPGDLPGRTALYRSLLYGKRVLFVLDDAYDAEQLRPLIPQGPACVLITSRWRHSGLVARDGAYRVELGPLSPEESVNLLAYLAPSRCVREEPDTVERITRLCGHLPLALRVVAEALTARPGTTLSHLEAALDEGAMEWLDVVRDAAASLRSAFACSYRALPPDVARMFRLLGLYDGLVITDGIAATIAGCGRMRARRLLDSLAEAHLLMELGEGRFRFHELIGVYAAERAEQDEPEPSRTAALDRALRAYGGRRRPMRPHVQAPFDKSYATARDMR